MIVAGWTKGLLIDTNPFCSHGRNRERTRIRFNALFVVYCTIEELMINALSVLTLEQDDSITVIDLRHNLECFNV
jgi:hypothetical protein